MIKSKKIVIPINNNESIETIAYQWDNKDTFEFEWTESHKSPVTFKGLMAISAYFGTVDLNTENDINLKGCDTCDDGSRYGSTITVNNATKNHPFKK